MTELINPPRLGPGFELLRLLLVGLLMFASFFLGAQFSAVQFQNELLSMGISTFDAQVHAGQYSEARQTCNSMMGQINMIAAYGIAFFNYGSSPTEVFNRCNSLAIMQMENGTDYKSYYTAYVVHQELANNAGLFTKINISK